jgi:hypothetical protein
MGKPEEVAAAVAFSLLKKLPTLPGKCWQLTAE